MLVIRQAQIQALAQGMFDAFVQRALAHVRQHFPALAQGLPAQALEHGVRHALDRAAVHRLEAERELYSYLNLACAFGPDFDTDPALPWAAQALAGAGPASIRVSRLLTAALRHRREARGWPGLAPAAAATA